ncbi:GAF domain-containing protein [Lichenicoccus roseus]|uniref:histidine kinase n=1 Tax=Lichenicoccus roseus TaxID=2683649 RepID=A0A5R9J720_9PROT|nr:GAF domain-containing protein [Lichenicoccus roseus]
MRERNALPDLPITACDVEPIHIPGLIQPHGVLLALRRAGGEIAVVAASANAGCDNATDPAAYLDAGSRARLERALTTATGAADLPLGTLHDRAGQPWDATLRLQATGSPGTLCPDDRDLALLELEPAGPTAAAPRLLLERLNQGLVEIQLQTDIVAACRAAVASLAAVSGFDRVMAYRFQQDLSGDVVAESRRVDGPPPDPAQPNSYLGLRFPASDIPAQARALYHSAAVRLIPDARVEPAPLLRLDGSDRAIDLSRAVLRGVAPVHLTYLANMGVRASMSIAIRGNAGLWGLFACHHLRGTLQVGPEARLAAEILARALSWRIAELQAAMVAGRLHSLAIASVPMLEDFSLARRERPPMDRWPIPEPDLAPRRLPASEGLHELLSACDADGLVVWPRVAGVEPLQAGTAPGAGCIERLCSWLDDEAKAASETRPGAPEWLLSTHALPELLPPDLAGMLYAGKRSEDPRHDASFGLLAVRLPGDGWLLLLRRELRRSVQWAGNPEKQAARLDVAASGDNATNCVDGRAASGGLLQLSPRASFEAWTQEVAGQSAHWSDADRRVALALRDAIGAVLLARSTEIARGNEELRRRSDETRFFADAAAHDLREPLWQIQVLSELVGEGLEDMALDQPPATAIMAELRQMTQSVVASAKRMHGMIEELSRLAIAGHQADRTEMVSLREVAMEALEDIRQGQALPQPLPLPQVQSSDRENTPSMPADSSISLAGLGGVSLCADRGQVRRVFQNLFSNAVKYRDPERPLCVVAEALPAVHGMVRVQVTDNGLGFDPAHATHLFEPFRRFPNRAAAATPGLGLGLAICQRIVVAHGGSIEARSPEGGGASFCFTLAEPDPATPAGTAS